MALSKNDSSKVAKEIVIIRKMQSNMRLDAVTQYAWKFVSNEKLWPKPTRTQSRNQTQQIQRDTARRFASSILIEFPGNHEGLDKALTRQEILALEMKMKATCPGYVKRNLNLNPPTRTKIILHIPSFANTATFCGDTSLTLSSAKCVKPVSKRERDPSPNPCNQCSILWLTRNNIMQRMLDRVETEEAQANP